MAGNTWEISVPCPQLCCKSKTALKNTVFQKRKEGVLTVGREEGKRQVQRKGSQMRLSLPVMRSQGTIDKKARPDALQSFNQLFSFEKSFPDAV